MKRAFSFHDRQKDGARMRQFGLCAHCGYPLDDVEEHAHHVVPNQSGRPGDPSHSWLSEADNCVILCDLCHYRVHADGRTRTGAVAPPSYFPHSHGNDTGAHRAWTTRLEAAARTIWP